jgi:hypothetical protein
MRTSRGTQIEHHYSYKSLIVKQLEPDKINSLLKFTIIFIHFNATLGTIIRVQ